MKLLYLCAAISISVLMAPLLGGCGRGPGGGSSGSARSFDSAPDAVKQAWNAAVEAARTNDYANAERLLYGLMRQELTDEQKLAAGKTLSEVHERMTTAADKGDAAALSAVDELRRNPPNRRLR